MTVLSASGLGVDGPEGESLVSDISLRLSAGETVLLAGPSGSGKTLLGKALGGLLEERNTLSISGTVERNGSVGFLFQNPHAQLVRRAVRQDVAFGLENAGVEPAAIEARIEDWADRLDATHLLESGIEDLSRGETAVVALLGTLVTDPEILILDEPLAPLDERNRRLVLAALDELDDRTLLIAEHDARGLLSRADRVLLLEGGKRTASGEPRQVARALSAAGVRLPFETEVGLERGIEGSDLPLVSGSG